MKFVPVEAAIANQGRRHGARSGEPRVPKMEGAINPINPRGGLPMLARTQDENRVFLAQFSSF
jgi:hypothetical protein